MLLLYDYNIGFCIYTLFYTIKAGQNPANGSLLRENLFKVNFTGASGQVTFDDVGDRIGYVFQPFILNIIADLFIPDSRFFSLIGASCDTVNTKISSVK